jgi:cytochrome c oxidase assembly factor CtaG
VARWRVVSFVTGVLLMLVVQVGPLDTLADEVLSAHMIQHLVIGDFASLLIVLGLTGPVLAPLLRIRVTRPLRVLAHPLVALTLWAVDLYAWHLPVLYQLAVRHDLVHALEHACFLWAGTLLWLGLIGPLPKPAWFNGWGKLGYVIGVRFIGGVLGNVLLWTQQVIYPVYNTTDAARGLNPLSDQNIAGAIMMIEEIILTILLLGWLFYRLAVQDDERQGLLDLASAQGFELSNARATRAATAGPGAAEHLRERILAPPPPRPGAPSDTNAPEDPAGEQTGLVGSESETDAPTGVT